MGSDGIPVEGLISSRCDSGSAGSGPWRGELSAASMHDTVSGGGANGGERTGKETNGQNRSHTPAAKLMKLVAKGLTNKEIAEELHLSVYTVKNHMSRILKQLDAVDRSEAVKTVRECGYEMSL